MMGTETEILLGADEGRDLLDRDNIPNRNQSRTCFSCEQPMVGLYCHNCGNKNDNFRRSIFSLIFELFESITAIDGRMWRSLRSLIIKPGQMSREFADGARQRWTSPVRMYIATSLLLFGYITLSDTQIVSLGAIDKSEATDIIKIGDAETQLSPKLLWFVKKSDLAEIPRDLEFSDIGNGLFNGVRDAQTHANSRESLEKGIAEINSQIEQTTSDFEKSIFEASRDGLQDRLDVIIERENDAAEALAEAEAAEAESAENSDMPSAESEGNQGVAASDPDTGGEAGGEAGTNTSESTDITAQPGDDGIRVNGLNGQSFTLGREGLRDMYRLILRRPELINDRINTEVKLAMFFMMPFAMLLGAIFIRGREAAMLYDHLVHAAYVHSFSFLLLFVFILLSQYTNLKGLIFVYTGVLLIYLPWSAKRMFKRGWFKSVLTAYGVGWNYTFVMILVMIGIIGFALQDIAIDITEQRALLGPPTPPTQTPVVNPPSLDLPAIDQP